MSERRSFRTIWERSIIDQNGCRIWAGRLDPQGYARCGPALGHRLAFKAFVGPIPGEMTVDHLCYQPACVEPAHLRLLTIEMNCKLQRSASKTHCVNNHEYTPENTYTRPAGNRDCRACIRDRVRRYSRKGQVA